MTSGLSHGDPGTGNVLGLPDGGIALVDWEEAGIRPLSHDIFKALTSSGVPVQEWPERDRRPEPGPTMLNGLEVLLR